jgi:hypothetical protein
LQPLNLQQGGGVQLYGLAYPGFHGLLSWAYTTVGKGFVVLSQPGGGAAGTSLTNIWSKHFIQKLLELAPVKEAIDNGKLRFYEHYYEHRSEIEEVTVDQAGNVQWKPLAQDSAVAGRYERIAGEPMPDFAALDWGAEMSRRGEEQWDQRMRPKRPPATENRPDLQ